MDDRIYVEKRKKVEAIQWDKKKETLDRIKFMLNVYYSHTIDSISENGTLEIFLDNESKDKVVTMKIRYFLVKHEDEKCEVMSSDDFFSKYEKKKEFYFDPRLLEDR